MPAAMAAADVYPRAATEAGLAAAMACTRLPPDTADVTAEVTAPERLVPEETAAASAGEAAAADARMETSTR